MLAFITSQQHQNTSGHRATRVEKIAASTGFCCISYYELLINLSTPEYFIYLPYIWNHRWPSSKCLKHPLKDHHCAWPLHSSGTADLFSASTELTGTASNISLETALWLQKRFVQKSEHHLKFSRIYSESKVFFKEFFSLIKTHATTENVSVQCIAYGNTMCAFLRKAVTSNANTVWKG